MQGDFTGMGTSALYGRMLMGLVSLAYHGLAAGAGAARDAMRLVVGRGPDLPGSVSDALQEAVGSGRLKLSTVQKYGNILSRFIRWYGSEDLTGLSPTVVSRFLRDRRAVGVGGGSRRVDLSALRTVLDKLLGGEATVALQYPAPSVPVSGARSEEVASLLAACADDTDRLLVLMLNIMKLRPGQLTALRGADIDRETRRLAVRREKTGECRFVPIPDALVVLIERVLREHQGECLFESPREVGGSICVRALQKRLARIGGRCGIETTCTAIRKAESVVLGDVAERQEAQGEPVAPSVSPQFVPGWLELRVRVSASKGLSGSVPKGPPPPLAGFAWPGS